MNDINEIHEKLLALVFSTHYKTTEEKWKAIAQMAINGYNTTRMDERVSSRARELYNICDKATSTWVIYGETSPEEIEQWANKALESLTTYPDKANDSLKYYEMDTVEQYMQFLLDVRNLAKEISIYADWKPVKLSQ